MTINAASSRFQTNQVIESKNTSFTVTHLVLKIKEVPSKTENGKKNDWTVTMSTFIPTHQRAKVRQRSSLVCSSLQVFSRCNSIFPGVILALLLHGLFSFNYCNRTNFRTRFNFVYFVLLAESTKFSSIRKPYTYTSVSDTTVAVRKFIAYESRQTLEYEIFTRTKISAITVRPLQAWLASGAHSKAVGSTSASEGTGRYQSVKIDITASLLKLRSTISLCSTIYWQFHLWLGKGKCEESSVLGEHEKGRSGY